MNKKLMKKRYISFVAFIITIVLVLVSSYAAEPKEGEKSSQYTVTIKGDNVEEGHTYEAYQIFKGDLFIEEQETNGGSEKKKVPILSNVEWGSGIDGEKLLEALKADETFKVDGEDETEVNAFEKCSSASQVAKVVDTFDDDSDKAKAFATHVGDNLKKENDKIISSKYDSNKKEYTFEISEAGYYLIKDKDDTLDGKYDAYTRYILKVVNSTEVKPKSEKTSVTKSLDPSNPNKKVDDHAINESFKFYLTATLPESTEYNEYKKYKLVFTDTMNPGITFDGIDSVTVNGNTTSGDSKEITINKSETNNENECYYKLETQEEADKSTKLTLTINDLKKISDIDLTKGAKVVVTYSVHLNELASSAIDTEEHTSTNSNSNEVTLSYSNDPNWKGEDDEDEPTGTTPSDKNYVFTYKINNTKYSEKRGEKTVLKDAGFTLYKKVKDETNTEEAKLEVVKLIWDESIEAYRPIGKDEEKSEDTEEKWEIKSQDNGKFDIKGLDVGTYILKETTTPGGYDTCKDIEIVIKADYTTTIPEQQVDLKGSTNMNNEVINVYGVDLPSTGARTLIIICCVSTVFALLGIILSKKEKED